LTNSYKEPPPSSSPLIPHFAQQRQPAGIGAKSNAAGGTSHEPETGAGSTTTFFQVPAKGKSVVYVIDRSASMGLNGAFVLAQRELTASLARLPPDASFQVIAYNRYAEPMRIGEQGSMLAANSLNTRMAERLIGALRAEGGTDHLSALKRGLLFHPDVLYFLSDADDLTQEQVRIVTAFNHGRTTIHAVELSSTSSTRRSSPLCVLAQSNGGTYRSVTAN
jgi:hypothetical protein